ncbi:hypothetical protein QZH41_012920 [Actinostola sp. cb2023]|nr:hypothetical protein QZH41_012920 [Actinostola sp. cb2023]
MNFRRLSRTILFEDLPKPPLHYHWRVLIKAVNIRTFFTLFVSIIILIEVLGHPLPLKLINLQTIEGDTTQSPNNPNTPSSSQSPANLSNPTTHCTKANSLEQTVTSSSSSMPNNCGSVTDNAPDLTSENLPVEFEFDQSILVGHSAGDNGEVEGTLDDLPENLDPSELFSYLTPSDHNEDILSMFE